MKTKICFKCGKERPLSEFYKHKMMKDGHVNKCKPCNKKDVIENRLKNLDYYRAYDRKRGNRQPPGYQKFYYENNKEKMMGKQIKWRDDNPVKYYAYTLLSNAVRDGRIKKQPCENCGSEDNIHGHHEDYYKPLEVNWLCAGCHKYLHTMRKHQ